MAKRYIAIAKIKNNPEGEAKFVKYRFNDLLNFTNFLDKTWPNWKWYNVYSNIEKNKGVQLANFTKNRRPVNKSI